MPKKIDEELKARAVRLVQEHRGEYPNLTAASMAVAKQVGVGKESVRRWVLQADVDAGRREGVTTEESLTTMVGVSDAHRWRVQDAPGKKWNCLTCGTC